MAEQLKLCLFAEPLYYTTRKLNTAVTGRKSSINLGTDTRAGP